MAKMAPALKALINAPHARPGPAPAPARIRDVYQRIAREADERQYGSVPWLAISAATTFTLNSADALAVLHQVAAAPPASHDPVWAAELIREVGLKCISFNGIPRSINCLGVFRAALAPELAARLERAPSRQVGPDALAAAHARGRRLWDSVYVPVAQKLVDRLAESHPDLPVHILESHYAGLLSNPDGSARGRLAHVGRSLTSLVAIACLRSQTGVGPQVLSHVFGLRKAVEQGIHGDEFHEAIGKDASAETKAIERLATDEGSEWILQSVDSIAEAIRSTCKL
ncbi:hypothetical protein P8C59_005696 [Phyllachora maydis]|uniref:Dol-P-Man:Man(5)GlcNAc(2)-PP-Dol alpha-1,3-mannosyltransferase n=1 Tax=Phyllachora maydis TaxID=1825666 RepID=A0AAD9I4Z5_9PEZI|nr:hypothetical protein P8C59_005696 [Phyllachora maydis]